MVPTSYHTNFIFARVIVFCFNDFEPPQFVLVGLGGVGDADAGELLDLGDGWGVFNPDAGRGWDELVIKTAVYV